MVWMAGLLLATLIAAQGDPPARALEAARQLKQRGAAAEASKAYEAALPGVRAAGDRKLLAQALLEAGQSALAAGNYPRALERGEEAAGCSTGSMRTPAKLSRRIYAARRSSIEASTRR